MPTLTGPGSVECSEEALLMAPHSAVCCKERLSLRPLQSPREQVDKDRRRHQVQNGMHKVPQHTGKVKELEQKQSV